MGDHEAHQPAHRLAGALADDTGAIAGLVIAQGNEGRRIENAAIAQCRDAGHHLHGRDSDAMAKADGHGRDILPAAAARPKRASNPRQLHALAVQHADAFEEFAVPLPSHRHRHMRGADIRAEGDDFRHGQPARLGVVVADAAALRQLDRPRGVIAAGHAGHTQFERHGGGEKLEGRARLINARGHPVEHRGGGGGGEVGGDEIGVAHHADDLAIADIHHHRSPAQGIVQGALGLHRLAQFALDSDVDGQAQRRAAGLQAFVEPLLHAAARLAIGAHRAQHMRRVPATRILPALRHLKAQADLPQGIDAGLLFLGDEAVEIDPAAVQRQALKQMCPREMRQDLVELLRQAGGVFQQIGPGIEC